jgi:hypothetical protein
MSTNKPIMMLEGMAAAHGGQMSLKQVDKQS